MGRFIRSVFGVLLIITITNVFFCLRGLVTSDRLVISRRTPTPAVGGCELREWALTTAFTHVRLRYRRYAENSVGVEPGWRMNYNAFDSALAAPVLTRVTVSKQWSRLGFDYWEGYSMFNGWELAIPMWCVLSVLAVLTALPGTWIWRRQFLARRAAQGFCARCGYDLRGAAHERCPECGAAVTAAAPV